MSSIDPSCRAEAASVSRREFVKTSAVVAAGAVTVGALAERAKTPRDRLDVIHVGVIGCGGRGTGAAVNALDADERVRIVALADVFANRLTGSRDHLAGRGERSTVSEDRCFTGFDAYEKLLELEEIDLVVLATPPHFRPMHFAAAVAAGKHVFMEKPVAVDPAGVRTVIAAADAAERAGLSVVAGTQRRHEACYLEAMRRLGAGELGDLVTARCYWNQGGLWVKEPQPGWSDMEWQLRNWLYFTWASGDHIVEQHVHNLDVCNWAFGSHPVSAMGMGGREVRTDPKYGHIFDHFAIEYVYADGRRMQSFCRQIDGCATRVEEHLVGTAGTATLRSGFARFEGGSDWRFKGQQRNPYEQEHVDLIASMDGGTYLNEGRRIAESTLTAIMGRMSAYTGKEVTWEQAMQSTLDLSPERYAFGPMPVPPVAVPGKTPLV